MKSFITKTLTLGLALLAAATWSASAAEEGKGSGKMQQRGEALKAALDKLNLNEDQKAKIKAITDKAAAEGREFMQAHAEELKAAKEANDHEKMKTIFAPMMEKRKALLDEIKAVLTDEQKQKLAESLPAHGEHHGKKDNK